jgi:hypothetical protein
MASNCRAGTTTAAARRLRVALTADGVETSDKHSRFLHLEDRPSRFDRVMLALVADEDEARRLHHLAS